MDMEEQTVIKLPGYDAATLDNEFGKLHKQVEEEAVMLETEEGREAFRLHWLGRKQGKLKAISDVWLKNAPSDKKGIVGQRFNELKTQIGGRILAAKLKQGLELLTESGKAFVIGEGESDCSKQSQSTNRKESPRHHPSRQRPRPRHPPSAAEDDERDRRRLPPSRLLHRARARRWRTDFYNFEALNFPPNHPARDTQDTLLLAGQQAKPLARPPADAHPHLAGPDSQHGSHQTPPIRIVVPGKVHRNDAADATHSPIFHQVEGLCVDTDITFSDLKGTLDHAMKALFGSSVKTRFFPSFFPFTEPSADVQIRCIFCAGAGCRRCKHSGWIELLGCGMVDPTVFAASPRARNSTPTRYNPANISGFAFGMGVERIAMMQYGISDIGHFYSGDMRFLEQFA